MTRFSRRFRKTIALTLLLLNFSGARVHACHGLCERTRVYHGPSLGFKMLAKTVGLKVSGGTWKRGEQALGAARLHKCSHELKSLRQARDLAPLTLIASVPVPVPSYRIAARPLAPAVTPDISPTPPPLSRK